MAAYGPFVMTTRVELIQAFEDYQAGRLGTILAAAHPGHEVLRDATSKPAPKPRSRTPSLPDGLKASGVFGV